MKIAAAEIDDYGGSDSLIKACPPSVRAALRSNEVQP